MIRRRDVLIGSTCLVAAGSAEALKPRRFVSLLPKGQRLDHILPREFSTWTSRDMSDQFATKSPDSLQAKLYGETVGRVYRQNNSDLEIMMLMAHGDVQSNELQLHRPEVCFPAFGFQILSNQPSGMKAAPGVTIPARQLLAKSSDHQETIIYWTRLGEYFPVTGSEQRFDRLKMALEGFIPDGLLARFSVADSDPASALAALISFIPALVRAVPRNKRQTLIGTARAEALASAGI